MAVVNWTNEEGVRFKPGLTGSSGFAGRLDERAVTIAGTDGSDFFSELERIGYSGSGKVDFDLLSYYELHVEQGPVLERSGAVAGIVDGI